MTVCILSFLTSYVHLKYLFVTFARNVDSAINSTFYRELQQKDKQKASSKQTPLDVTTENRHRLQLLLVNRQLVSKKPRHF